MGPRLFSRGNAHTLAASKPPSRRLQWGRGSSAAETGRDQPSVRQSMVRLQWGRGSSAAETTREEWRRPSALRASMGPRLFSRGNLWFPRTLPPGKFQLQWGRGSSAAETTKLCAVVIEETVLQWGRGSSAAETSFGCSIMNLAKSRFNGAAALQPRKLALRLLCNPLAMWLQWGRGSSAAETGHLHGPRDRHGHGFNGAAALQPRKPRGTCGPRSVTSTLQWGRGSSAAETTCLLALTAATYVLQWGRGSSAAETLRFGAVFVVGEVASMGPRLFSRGNCCRPYPLAYRRSRFNGAAALQPRKRFNCERVREEARGFNGAAALQPRKPTARALMAPGENRFNGAAALQPRKLSSRERPRRASRKLQWGRGSSAAETPAWRSSAASWRPASMGPRLFSRGNGHGIQGETSATAASMGPRLFSRGNPPLASTNVPAVRRFNGAAALQPRKRAI